MGIVDELSKRLVDEGRIVEGGWMGFRKIVLARNASDDQLNDMRIAFFAGAQHLYASIMSILDPGEEPTEKDLARMQLIDNELDGFIKNFKERLNGTER